MSDLPDVYAMLICERVGAADGRIVIDKVMLETFCGPQVFSVFLLVGGNAGQWEISLNISSEDGQESAPAILGDKTINLDSPLHQIVYVIPGVIFNPLRPGPYWVSVFLDGRSLDRRRLVVT